jgi:serine O-acetyltransferase
MLKPRLSPLRALRGILRAAEGAVARVREDLDVVVRNDPACRSKAEAFLAYPGMHALWVHHGAEALWSSGHMLLARVVSHGARMATGVDIHPAAKIGRRVFIDHGMGVVIGETATVGDGCLIYKGVVLGGTSRAQKSIRHPQLGKNVTVGSNACILGDIDIGEGARIGSGSVVIRPVPQGATVVGVPGRIVLSTESPRGRLEARLDHASLPDPVSDLIRKLALENEALAKRMARLESALDVETEVGIPSIMPPAIPDMDYG